MHIPKSDVPVKLQVPGATARQKIDFGKLAAGGTLAAEYFSFGAGTDIAPLLKGLDGDLCDAPHWGYLIEGDVTVTYRDGRAENLRSGDIFYWPPGHTVKVTDDAEIIMFSPQEEHNRVLDHIERQIRG